MTRELRVAEEVAQLLSAPVLAQLEAIVDDPDNVCCVCESTITGSSAEVVVYTDGEAVLVKMAHSECAVSSVCQVPELGEQMSAGIEAVDGFKMSTLLGRRQTAPRALIFLELELTASGVDEDPLERYALALGLSPISGSIEDIAPPRTELFTIETIPGGLGLRNKYGTETVPADDASLEEWLSLAAGQALVIVARGLGLSRPKPVIEEALALRPAWGAVATVAS